jgi:two-component sensor histidine kinase
MKRIHFYFFLIAGLGTFFIDSQIPLGYAPWLFYIILMFIFISFGDKNKIIQLTVIYTILLIAGYFLSPGVSFNPDIPVLNRLAAILVLGLTSLLGIREKEAKKVTLEILERIKDIFIALDTRFKIIFMNKKAHEIALVNETVAGKDYFEIFQQQDDTLRPFLEKALAEQQPLHLEKRLSVQENILDVSIYPSDKGISIFAKDITDVVKSEKKLKKILKDRDTLLKEVHHRTKNNLQLIISLLNLQFNTAGTEEMKKMITETKSRIISLAVLYDQLYLSGNTYTVDLCAFLKDIVMKLEKASNFGLIKMNHDLDIEPCRISLDHAIPLGLIINELYTNSLKYAFNGNRTGAITIKAFYEGEDQLKVHYKDNGKGLPADFNIDSSDGLGSSIISAFVDQLEGTLEYRNNNGAEFNMFLKIKKHSDFNEIETDD